MAPARPLSPKDTPLLDGRGARPRPEPVEGGEGRPPPASRLPRPASRPARSLSQKTPLSLMGEGPGERVARLPNDPPLLDGRGAGGGGCSTTDKAQRPRRGYSARDFPRITLPSLLDMQSECWHSAGVTQAQRQHGLPSEL